MTASLPASSRSDCDSRRPAAVHQRPSGRSRSPRIDRSTITSPATRPRTQIRPGVRGTIGPPPATALHNHSPPHLTEAPVQISDHAARSAPEKPCDVEPVAGAKRSQKDLEPSERRQSGTPTMCRRARPSASVQSCWLRRPGLTVRGLLSRLRDHHEPAPAAARAALRLLHQRGAVAVALRAARCGPCHWRLDGLVALVVTRPAGRQCHRLLLKSCGGASVNKDARCSSTAGAWGQPP